MIARINEFLAQMLDEQTTEIFNGKSSSDVPDILARIVLLSDEIVDLEDKVRLLIRKQLAAGKDIQDIYEEELEKLNQQLGNMKEARDRLKGESLATQTSTSNQQATLEELAELTLERFWHQESRKINQMLNRIMGKCRLVILNGEVIGVSEVNRNQRRRK
jgi:methanogenic corrinoid protein MtbC1